LNDFASVIFVANEPNRDSERAALMSLHEETEGFGIARSGLGNEGTIFLGFELSDFFVRRSAGPRIHGGSDMRIMGTARRARRESRSSGRRPGPGATHFASQ
jgi:hypothetical protein